MLMKSRIIFDLGDVLIDINARRALTELSKSCRAEEASVFSFFLSPTHLKFMSGQLSPEEFYCIFAQNYRFSLNFSGFFEIWNHILGPVKKDMPPLIRQLKMKGYVLLLCSNTDPVHFQYVNENYSIMRSFQRFYLSFQIGRNKPDPEIFRQILKREDVAASECLFIDDSAANIRAARSLGFQGIRMKSPAQLGKELDKLKIL